MQPQYPQPNDPDQQVSDVLCYCGLNCIVRTTKKPGPNIGRTFIACPKMKGEQCKFFKWESGSLSGSSSPRAQQFQQQQQQPQVQAPAPPQPPAKRLKRTYAVADLSTSSTTTTTTPTKATMEKEIERGMAIISTQTAQMLTHAVELNSLRMQNLEQAVKKLCDVLDKFKEVKGGGAVSSASSSEDDLTEDEAAPLIPPTQPLKK